MGGQDNRQILADVYNSSTDSAVKHAILRSFMIVRRPRAAPGARARARRIRSCAARPSQQLGVMGAHERAGRSSTRPRRRSTSRSASSRRCSSAAAPTASIELAKTEKDPELRKTAVRNLGLMGASKTGDALRAIYSADASPEIRKAVIQGLFIQNNATCSSRSRAPRRTRR